MAGPNLVLGRALVIVMGLTFVTALHNPFARSVSIIVAPLVDAAQRIR